MRNFMTRMITKVLPVLFVAGCISATTILAPCNAKLKSADGPLVQAHRGGRFEYDDNALGGFRRSLEKGIRGFETDIRFTKDHENFANAVGVLLK